MLIYVFLKCFKICLFDCFYAFENGCPPPPPPQSPPTKVMTFFLLVSLFRRKMRAFFFFGGGGGGLSAENVSAPLQKPKAPPVPPPPPPPTPHWKYPSYTTGEERETCLTVLAMKGQGHHHLH